MFELSEAITKIVAPITIAIMSSTDEFESRCIHKKCLDKLKRKSEPVVSTAKGSTNPSVFISYSEDDLIRSKHVRKITTRISLIGIKI